MSKMPPIPKEQRSFRGPRHLEEHAPHARHDEDTNIDERGQTANMRQNLRPQRSVQDR
jgi:hypothetical protein